MLTYNFVQTSIQKQTKMRKIRIMEHTSLDGVIQQEGEGGFSHGNWTAPYRTPAGLEAVMEAHGSTLDLLLGRITYDIWAGYWPNAENRVILLLQTRCK